MTISNSKYENLNNKLYKCLTSINKPISSYAKK